MQKFSNNQQLKKSDHNRPSGGWEIVYTGFVLILLCFFIMLSSFATLEQSKISRFVRSFVDAVSVHSGGVSFKEGKEVMLPATDMVPIRNELAEIFKDLQIFTATYGFDEEVELELGRDGLIMKLGDSALFDVGSASISPFAEPLLQKIGHIIAKGSFWVRIEGHTDDLPIHTSQYPSNWELSTIRAVNVLRYFKTHFDIPSGQLSAAGFGPHQPILPNTSEANRARNRRVEIILKHEDRP